jgi:hypothetical protein|tara:strand:- start:6927 stop:7112 length:186 start_codon:yes stop_codon:yes gene_type:complete
MIFPLKTSKKRTVFENLFPAEAISNFPQELGAGETNEANDNISQTTWINRISSAGHDCALL